MNEDSIPGPADVMDGLTQLAPVDHAEVDSQVATAMRYPRSIKQCQQRILDLATLDETTAGACTYSFPRGTDDAGKKKFITGPSIHFAKIVSTAWRHIRVSGRVVAVTGKEVVAEAVCWDLEANVAWRSEARRPILYGKNHKYAGQRYSDDMVTVTGMAAISIAQRNAVFKTIPEPLWRGAYQATRKVALGTEATLPQRRDKMIKHFQERGIGPDQLLALIGKRAFQDVGLEELAKIRELAQSIEDGHVTVDDLLADLTNGDSEQPATKLREAMERSKKRTSKKVSIPAAETPPSNGNLSVPALAAEIDELFSALSPEEQSAMLSNCGMKTIDDLDPMTLSELQSVRNSLE